MTRLHGVSRYEKVKWDQIHIQFNQFWHTTQLGVPWISYYFYPEHSSFLGYDAVSLDK